MHQARIKAIIVGSAILISSILFSGCGAWVSVNSNPFLSSDEIIVLPDTDKAEFEIGKFHFKLGLYFGL